VSASALAVAKRPSAANRGKSRRTVGLRVDQGVQHALDEFLMGAVHFG
jgi:hypothetical protein